MQHKDFSIGIEFECGGRRWRCTDVGTRTAIAISLDHLDDPSWYSGPPYAVSEIVFDENDMPACTLLITLDPAIVATRGDQEIIADR